MTLCKFFPLGTCRYGNNCRFEHPGANNNNRFSAFGGGGGNGGPNNRNVDDPPYNLNKETIQLDLTTERPQWILSSYGPGRDAPEQLFGGFPREQSFEEVRLVYEEGALVGNPQGALSQIEGIYREAENQNQNALQNLSGAIDYIVSARNKNPNRLSVLQNNTNGTFAVGRQQQQTSNPFGGGNPFGAPSAVTPFGKPATAATNSPFGQTPNPFGAAPAFGQPAQPSGLGQFGQPSSMSQAFGQPSALGGGSAPAFGQTPSLGQKQSPFGAPAFGQPAQAPAFGQPASLGGGSGFGQPSTLGQKSSPFGSTPANTGNPFGSATASAGPFGQMSNGSPFGQAAATANSAAKSPFGLSSGTAAPFGQPATSSGPFGTPAAGQPAAAPEQSMDMSGPSASLKTPFGQPSVLGSGGRPFGNPSQSQPAASNPFGQPSAAANSFGASTPQTVANGTGAGGPNPYGPNAARQHPPASSYLSKNPDGTLAAFKGKSVTYQAPPREGAKPFPAVRNFDGSLTRVWNPDGPPPYYKDTEAPPEAYDAAARAAWEPFLKTGRFQNATIPEVPPLREWCLWDF